jgi:hypothetical protein
MVLVAMIVATVQIYQMIVHVMIHMIAAECVAVLQTVHVVILFVVMVFVMVMKPMKHAQMVKYLIAMVQTNVGQSLGLVMVSPTVKINSMVQI